LQAAYEVPAARRQAERVETPFKEALLANTMQPVAQRESRGRSSDAVHDPREPALWLTP
jgi:hypothetical protein